MRSDTTIETYDRLADQYAQQWDGMTPDSDEDDLVLLLDRELPRKSSVLDAGSGSGRDLQRLVALGHSPQGLDASDALSTIARQYAPVVTGDMRDMPFSEASFDGILLSASLLHLDANGAVEAMNECHRTLKPNGILVLSVKGGEGEIVDSQGRFFHFYDATSLDELISSAGFSVLSGGSNVDSARNVEWLNRICRRIS